MELHLCNLDDIAEGKSRAFTLGRNKLFAVKKHSHLYLYLNRCPHLGTELEWEADNFLDPQGQYIRCSTHGALFSIKDGECLQGPCVGDRLQSIPFRLCGERIMVTVAQGASD